MNPPDTQAAHMARTARRARKPARSASLQWLLALLLAALLGSAAHYGLPRLNKTEFFRVMHGYVLHRDKSNQALRAEVEVVRRAYRQAARIAPQDPIRLPQKESLRPLPPAARQPASNDGPPYYGVPPSASFASAQVRPRGQAATPAPPAQMAAETAGEQDQAASPARPQANPDRSPDRHMPHYRAPEMDLAAMENRVQEHKQQMDDLLARSAANTQLQFVEARWGQAIARARSHTTFWLRLAIALPVVLLALGLLALRRPRGALAWGLAGFALFMVCVELLPYALDSRKTRIVRDGIIQL